LVRHKVWRNTGFGDLRKIRTYLEYFEPRYDPTVVPTSALRSPFESKDDLAVDPTATPSPKTLSSHGYYSVSDYTAMYLSGDLTPTAVAKALLPLILKDSSPPGQHSAGWFDSNAEMIMAAAEASTLRYQKKTPLGPLDGVPAAVKDEYDIEGYTTSLGSVNDYTGQAAPGETITAWCVRKMDEAGAINFGKLHMHEFGLGMYLTFSFRAFLQLVRDMNSQILRHIRQQPHQRHTSQSL